MDLCLVQLDLGLNLLWKVQHRLLTVIHLEWSGAQISWTRAQLALTLRATKLT